MTEIKNKRLIIKYKTVGYVSRICLLLVLAFCSFLLFARLSSGDEAYAVVKPVFEKKAVRVEKSSSNIDKIEDLLDEFESLLPSELPEDSVEIAESVGIKALLSSLLSGVSGQAGTLAADFALMIGVAILFICAEQISAISSDTLHTAVTAATAAILSIPVFSSMTGVLISVKESLEAGGSFFGALIPIMTSLTALGGRGVTASTEAVCMNITLGFISGFLCEYVMPLSATFFALALVTASDNGGICSAVAGAIRGVFNFLIGAASVLLVATLALQTVISSGTDGLAMRGIKYAVSGMIPIVGTTVSGALSTLTAGLGYAGGVVGVSSIALLVGIMGAPLVTLLLYRLIMKIAMSVASLSGGGVGERVIGSFLSALDALIATLAFSVVVYILEIVIFMRCVTGTI